MQIEFSLKINIKSDKNDQQYVKRKKLMMRL